MPPRLKPRETARMRKLAYRAERMIERDSTVIYDVAANFGQIVGNVRDTDWFQITVMREIGSDADVALIPPTMTRVPADWRPA